MFAISILNELNDMVDYNELAKIGYGCVAK